MPTKPPIQTSHDRVEIISAVKTYLGFFVLVVLVVETVLGALALKIQGDNQLVVLAHIALGVVDRDQFRRESQLGCKLGLPLLLGQVGEIARGRQRQRILVAATRHLRIENQCHGSSVCVFRRVVVPIPIVRRLDDWEGSQEYRNTSAA